MAVLLDGLEVLILGTMRFILFVWISSIFTCVFAVRATPLTGYWLTRKHDTNMPSSVVQLSIDDNDHLVGRVVAGFYRVDQPLPDQTCSRCGPQTTDGHYGIGLNQNIMGSYAMWGFKYERDDLWTNGKVLRVKTGQLFRARMQLVNKDKIDLTVRYGIFSQTLSWSRVSKTDLQALCAGDLSHVTTHPSFRVACLPKLP